MKFSLGISLVIFLVIGCSSGPSKKEAKSAIEKSIYDYYTCKSFNVESIRIDKIGLTQEKDSKKWWPVRAFISGKCTEIKKITDDPLEIFSDSTFIIINDTTFILDYRLDKNMYNEWEATTLK